MLNFIVIEAWEITKTSINKQEKAVLNVGQEVVLTCTADVKVDGCSFYGGLENGEYTKEYTLNDEYAKVHKVTELMMMARRAMSKLNFPRFVSLYPKRILVWGSVSLRVASDKAREIQFGHSPSCHHHQFCHFMNFRMMQMRTYFYCY